MAVHVLKDGRLLIAGRDFSSRVKNLGLSLANDVQDASAMGIDTKVNVATLNEITLDVEALQEFGTGLIDATIQAQLAAAATQYFVAAEGGDFGEIGYFFDGVLRSYVPISGQAGSVLPIRFAVAGASDIIRGTVAEDGLTTRTANGNGTELNLGTAAATKRIWAQLHVISGSAGTLDVVIQSDATGFASPTTQLTFSQVAAASAPTSQVVSAVGPGGTDDFWRASWTIPSGNWRFLVVFGIQTIN